MIEDQRPKIIVRSITIAEVLHEDFVAIDEMASILNWKRQTVHNKVWDGTLKLRPYGRVMGLPHVYRREEVEQAARELGRIR